MSDTPEPDPPLADPPDGGAPPSPARARLALLGWLVFAALCLALEAAGLVDGLAMSVPLVIALVVARLVDTRGASAVPALRVLGAVVAILCAALALLAFRWGIGLFGLSAFALTVLLGAASVTIVLLLDPGARGVLLRPLGLDPGSAVHVVSGLAFVLTLLFTLTAFLETQSAPSDPVSLDLRDALVALVADGALALAGVGFLQTRGVRATLARLDVRPIGLRDLLAAVLIAGVFHAVVGGLEQVESALFPHLAVLEDRFDYAFVGISPALGSILLSLGVGVGEELLFRGAMQPRFGVVASAALFAAFHVQYQVPGILMIFLVGLALGLLKRHTSTTFTSVVHVLYDIAAFLF